MNNIITYDIQLNVKIRKYEVDIEKLKQLLRQHKNRTNKEIARQLNIPLTQAEHYFRTDKYFAIPEPNIWYELKELLNIQDDSFDKCITEFIEQPGVFDMANRLYDTNGIAPTILADSGNKMYLVR